MKVLFFTKCGKVWACEQFMTFQLILIWFDVDSLLVSNTMIGWGKPCYLGLYFIGVKLRNMMMQTFYNYLCSV